MMGHQWMFDDAWVLQKSTSGEQREIKKHRSQLQLL
jgi:hypothetical protein